MLLEIFYKKGLKGLKMYTECSPHTHTHIFFTKSKALEMWKIFPVNINYFLHNCFIYWFLTVDEKVSYRSYLFHKIQSTRNVEKFSSEY